MYFKYQWEILFNWEFCFCEPFIESAKCYGDSSTAQLCMPWLGYCGWQCIQIMCFEYSILIHCKCFSYLKVLVSSQIKFGEEGWKERYYAEKFEVKTKSDFEKMQKHLVREVNIVPYCFYTYVRMGECWLVL